MKKYFSKISSRSGQALIEAVAALSILSIGFLAAFALLSQAIGASRYISDGYVATYLAAEGIEIIKNISDTYSIQNDLNALVVFQPCQTVKVFEVEYLDTIGLNPGNDYLPLVLSGPANRLRFDSLSGLYGYDPSWAETSYTRTVTVSPGDIACSHVNVVSEVEWVSRGGETKRVQVDNKIYGWVQR